MSSTTRFFGEPTDRTVGATLWLVAAETAVMDGEDRRGRRGNHEPPGETKLDRSAGFRRLCSDVNSQL